MNAAPMSVTEAEVRRVLAAYKMALVKTGYRGTWHRLMCWLGDREARNADKQLVYVETLARSTVNASGDHQRVARLISSQQPEHVRDHDKFLSLIQNT